MTEAGILYVNMDILENLPAEIIKIKNKIAERAEEIRGTESYILLNWSEQSEYATQLKALR